MILDHYTKSDYQKSMQQKILQGLADSPTINRYRHTIRDCMHLYYPNISDTDLDKAISHSIKKRFRDTKEVRITNSYKRYRDENDKYKDAEQNTTLIKLSDYILSREPIVTPYGTMFKHHGTEPNPLMEVVQSFLDLRTTHKKKMFTFPKGSEDFEKYNLLQLLDKIDANGIYGTLGQFSCLIYNINVASSITAAGREFVSTMTLLFESFLANNVKFGSLNEVVEFINHIKSESLHRRFRDEDWITHWIEPEECFAKLILSCGYRWVPNDRELDIIWRIVNNLSREDLNRVYYANNLYEFVENTYVKDLLKNMIIKLDQPVMNSLEIPDQILEEANLFTDLLFEYVYYKYMYIDRIDRCDNMIKSVTMVSDTDSTIISLDAWYHYVLKMLDGTDLKINNDTSIFADKVIENMKARKLDYNFQTDEIIPIDEERAKNDFENVPRNDNVRFTIINILAYALDKIVNHYMEQACRNNFSLKQEYHDSCRIIAKTEFLFRRLMMTLGRKHYASFIEVQEGNMVPFEEGLDVKGIDILEKSVTPESTKKALKKILLEDILTAPSIDQVQFIKDIAIFQKQIIESIRSGSKEFFKPATIKSLGAYTDPMKIQGIKASIAWNAIREPGLDAINLSERNAINIVKVIINRSTVDKIKDSFPEVYQNMLNALDDETFKKLGKEDPKTREKKVLANFIDCIALPLNVELPKWLEPFIDYDTIIANNLHGFPYESIGLQRLGKKKNVGYTNIIEI